MSEHSLTDIAPQRYSLVKNSVRVNISFVANGMSDTSLSQREIQ